MQGLGYAEVPISEMEFSMLSTKRVRTRAQIIAGLALLGLTAGIATPAHASEVDVAKIVAEVTSVDPTTVAPLDLSQPVEVSNDVSSLQVEVAAPSSGDFGARSLQSVEYAYRDSTDSGPALYSVLLDEGAPTEHRYEFTVDDRPAVLSELPNGSILVSSAETGEAVNFISPAWAVDAEQRHLPSEYQIDGGTLIQTIDLTGASFPVVADPALACNGIHCTVQYNKAETRLTAIYGVIPAGGIAGACASLGSVVAGVACGIAFAYILAVAADAYDQGKCFGVQTLIYAPALYPVIYTGGNCV